MCELRFPLLIVVDDHHVVPDIIFLLLFFNILHGVIKNLNRIVLPDFFTSSRGPLVTGVLFSDSVRIEIAAKGIPLSREKHFPIYINFKRSSSSGKNAHLVMRTQFNRDFRYILCFAIFPPFPCSHTLRNLIKSLNR